MMKKETPIVKFGTSSDRKVLIVVGSHRSEPSSQVAAIHLINKLNKNKNIKGTIYVIHFVSPKVTSKNQRFHSGTNLNSIANKKRSLISNIVRSAKTNSIIAVGDFHCTMPGRNPGKNVIMGPNLPTAENAKMAIAISKLTKYPYRNYNNADRDYPDALEDVLNLAGIASVTCEVKTPHER